MSPLAYPEESQLSNNLFNETVVRLEAVGEPGYMVPVEVSAIIRDEY